MSTPNKKKQNNKISLRQGQNLQYLSKSSYVSPNKQKLTVGNKVINSHMLSSKTVNVRPANKVSTPDHWGCIVPKMYQRRLKNRLSQYEQRKSISFDVRSVQTPKQSSQVVLLKYLKRKYRKTKLNPEQALPKKIPEASHKSKTQAIIDSFYSLQNEDKLQIFNSNLTEQQLNYCKTLQSRIKWKSRVQEFVYKGIRKISLQNAQMDQLFTQYS